MLQKIEFPYGKSYLYVELDDTDLLQVVTPLNLDKLTNEEEEINQALNNPIESSSLDKLISENSKVAIIVSDITRPLPVKKILPPILKQIKKTGCPNDNLQITFALGNHRQQTPEEQETILGQEIYQKYSSNDFDKNDVLYLGTTSFGTPLWISKNIYEADIRICIGNIEFHYFAGFTGGLKAILPGVCGKETISHNHSLMNQPSAAMGILEGNPVRMDLEEAGQMLGTNYIFNVVLDEDKKIVKAVAGDPIRAHREGCKFAEKLYQVDIPELADIVIASAGGFPKDMSLYQAQKAMENAKKVLKPYGSLILIAQCKDGPGEGIFKEWMTGSQSTREVINKFEQDFVLGGHKAGVIAKILESTPVYLVSDMDQENTEKYFFHYASSVDWAIEVITEQLGCQPKIIAMPYAHLTRPMVRQLVATM